MTDPQIAYRQDPGDPLPARPAVLYFGEPWDVPALDGATHVATPYGADCLSCGEPISDGDRGWLRPVTHSGHGSVVCLPVHAECDLRSIVGHTYGYCECSGYQTNRATARLVWQAAIEGNDPVIGIPVHRRSRAEIAAYLAELDATLAHPQARDDGSTAARWRRIGPDGRRLVRQALGIEPA